MFNQIRQKKKKEAVRRLSQSRGSHLRAAGLARGGIQNTMKRGFESSNTNPRLQQQHLGGYSQPGQQFGAKIPGDKSKRYISPLNVAAGGSGDTQNQQGSSKNQVLQTMQGGEPTTALGTSNVFGGGPFGQTKGFGVQTGTSSTAAIKPFGSTPNPFGAVKSSVPAALSSAANTVSGISGGSTFGSLSQASNTGIGAGIGSGFGSANQSKFGEGTGSVIKPVGFGVVTGSLSSRFGTGTTTAVAQPVFGGLTTSTATTGSSFAFGAGQTVTGTSPSVFGGATHGSGTATGLGSATAFAVSDTSPSVFGAATCGSATVTGSGSRGLFVNTMMPVSFGTVSESGNNNGIKSSVLGGFKGPSVFSSSPVVTSSGSLQGLPLSGKSQSFEFGLAGVEGTGDSGKKSATTRVFCSTSGLQEAGDSGLSPATTGVFGNISRSQVTGASGESAAASDIFGGKSGSQEAGMTFGAWSAHAKEPAAKIRVRVFDGPSGSQDAEHATGPVSVTKPFGTRATSSSGDGGRGVFGQAVSHPIKGSVNTSPVEKGFEVDTSKNTSLVIKEIPEVYNKNQWLKRFYSRFGEVVKVLCNPNRKSATVTFRNHDDAAAAKRKGRHLRQGFPPVAIFWRQMRSNSRRLSADSEVKNVERESVQSRGSSTVTSPRKENTMPVAHLSSNKSKVSQQARIRQILQELDPRSFPSADSAGEKYAVLDSVDKKIRQGITKSSDLATAKATKGTCRDMCPEKERYMREDRRRLSIFEIVPGTDGSLNAIIEETGKDPSSFARGSSFSQLKTFGAFKEVNPQVDHTKAVKEYSGSAADKLEPLPHELRPVSVLKMTMDYLVTSIMDSSGDRWAEWFDFVWNRTRGIRKDITQQHLCDPGCVDLVEKTTRFHIFCSHALCEQEMSAFDPKINNENLTKCLQTLKQFYDDLYKEKGIVCLHEAEFRAYDVLLNLNEGDTLRQVMQLREEVRRSPEVKFALDVFHSLNDNNYAKFFKLVRSATYLNGCILHRYFTQVRSRALRTINYSLSIPNRTTPFPLKDLVELLAFESEQEAVEHCTFYALDADEQFVNLSKATFIEPEDKLAPKIATKLIESKRKISIGEVVYGATLPLAPNHVPTLSFNDNGQYLGHIQILDQLEEGEDGEKENLEPPAKEQQTTFTSFTTSSSFPTVSIFGSSKLSTVGVLSSERLSLSSAPMFGQGSRDSGLPQGFARPFGPSQFSAEGAQAQLQQPPQVVPKPSLVYTNEDIKQTAKGLFVEVIDEMVAETSRTIISKVQMYFAFIEHVSREFIEEVTHENIRRVAQDTLQDQKDEWLAAETLASKERSLQAVHSDIVEEVVGNECVNLSKQINRAVKQRLVEQSKEDAIQHISAKLLGESVESSVYNLAREAISEETERRDAALKALGEEIRRRRTLVLFKKWIKVYRSRVHLKRLLRAFPCMPPLYTDRELLERLLSQNTEVSAKQKAVLDGFVISPQSAEEQQQKFHEVLRKRQEDLLNVRNELFRPLDIPLVLADSLTPDKVMSKTTAGSTRYWKLLISFPGPCDLPRKDTVGMQGLVVTPGLVREKFKRGTPPQDSGLPVALKQKVELLSLYRAETRLLHGQTMHFGVCTKACYGVLSNTEVREVQESRQFLGTSAVLLVISAEELQKKALQDASVRLRRLVQSKPPLPKVPVIALVLDGQSYDGSTDSLASMLGVPQLKKEELVSDFEVVTVSTAQQVPHLEEKVKETVTWFGQHSTEDLGLKTARLIDFIEEAIARYFTTPVNEDLTIRRKARLEQQCPEAIVDLYNGVLDHLADVVTSQQLCSVSWPVQEFTHNNQDSDEETDLPSVTWNLPSTLQSSAHAQILQLALPHLPPSAEDGTWDSESKLCLEYASKLTERPAPLLSRVEWILNQTRRSLEEVDFLSSDPHLDASRVPWPDVLEACVHFLLRSLHEDPGYAQTNVHYFTGDWGEFVLPSLWRESVNDSKVESFKVLHKRRVEAQKPRKSRNDELRESFLEVEENLAEILERTRCQFPDPPHGSPALPSHVVDTRVTLLRELESSKRQSQRFDEFLERTQIEEEKSPLSFIFSMSQKRKADVLPADKKAKIQTDDVLASHSLSSPHDVSVDSLESSLLSLRDSVRSQRQADEIAELKLKSFLET